MMLVVGLGLALTAAIPVERVVRKNPAAEASSADSFAAQTWRLFELQVGPDSAPTQPNAPITLQFDAVAGRVSGTGGCNRYFAEAVVRDRKLTISAIGATRMACPAPAMAEESAYLAALERATGYLVEDEVLTLTLAGGGWLRYRKLLD